MDQLLASTVGSSNIETQSASSGATLSSSAIVPFEFKEIAPDTEQENKAQEIERRNLDKMRLAISLEYKKIQIKDAVRKMHAALAKRGTLAEPVIDSYSEMVSSGMHGRIRATVISPATAKLLGAGFAKLEEQLVSSIVYDKYTLEEEFLLENYRRAGFTGIGISAGEGELIEDGYESSDDEGWNPTNPAWYDDEGNLLPIEERPAPPKTQQLTPEASTTTVLEVHIDNSSLPVQDNTRDTSFTTRLSEIFIDKYHMDSISLKYCKHLLK